MSFQCSFYFHGSSNDFLSAKEKEQWITYMVKATASAKDTIEAIGVPHVEVLKIVVNGSETSLNSPLRPGDNIEVFPYTEPTSTTATPSFVLDVHLGKLVRLLRMLGIDSVYQNNLSDQEIVAIAVAQKRTVLTRDRGLLKHKVLTAGYWLRSQDPEKQLAEVVRRYSLCVHLLPFSRCMACNGLLQVVTRETVAELLPLKTKKYFSEFYQCCNCRRIYWKGSHYENMQQVVRRVRSVAC